MAHPTDRAQRRLLDRKHKYGEKDQEYIRQREELEAKELEHELASHLRDEVSYLETERIPDRPFKIAVNY